MYKPKVYTASKPYYHKFWKTLREDPDWDFVEWTASWVNHPDLENEMAGNVISTDVYVTAWVQNLRDVKESDFLIVYAKPTDPIRGTLVEAGYAIGSGIPVLAVGLTPEHNWTWHPGVKTFGSIREARMHLFRFTTMVPPARKGRPTNE
jgi:hypothetical protein